MFEKILVCLDGSRLAEQILPYAAEQALRFQSELVLFRAYIIPSTTIAEDIQAGAEIGPDLLKREDKRLRNDALSYLEKVAVPLRQQGLKVTTTARKGSAGDAITDFAREDKIDLIALATHGHGGLGRVVFGSVADKVLRGSGLPILIIKPREAEF